MDTILILILILVIGGAAITVYGLAKAFFDARAQVRKEQWRIDRTSELTEQERGAMKAIPADNEHQDERNVAQEAWNEKFAAEGLTRATYGNMAQLHQFEAQRLVGELLTGARNNLLLAGVGVVLSTVGSVWDITRG